MDERFLPDWDENALSLGKPQVMDVPTLIEYIERELETPEETLAREAKRKELHRKWHETAGIISACCIQTGVFQGAGITTKQATERLSALITPNEIRSKQKMERIKEEFLEKSEGGGLVYLDEGMKIQPLPIEKQHLQLSAALDSLQESRMDTVGPRQRHALNAMITITTMVIAGAAIVGVYVGSSSILTLASVGAAAMIFLVGLHEAG